MATALLVALSAGSQTSYRIPSHLSLTLKAPSKNVSEKRCLLKSSAANNCLTLPTNLSIEANRVDLDLTAPIF